MNRLASLIPREVEPTSPPFVEPVDVNDLNQIVVSFNPQFPRFSVWQMNELACLFLSRQMPQWTLDCVHFRCRQAHELARMGSVPSWPLDKRLEHPVRQFSQWLAAKAPSFRFPNPPDGCVPTALVMECVEDRVKDEFSDFMDYWNLRVVLANRAGVDAQSYRFSIQDWVAVRCYQRRLRTGKDSFVCGAYLTPQPHRFSIH